MEGPLTYRSGPHVYFEVEKVIGISTEGNYQVQWAPAWVSKFHLVGCEHLIEEFLHRQKEKENTPNIIIEPCVSQMNAGAPYESVSSLEDISHCEYSCNDQAILGDIKPDLNPTCMENNPVVTGDATHSLNGYDHQSSYTPTVVSENMEWNMNTRSENIAESSLLLNNLEVQSEVHRDAFEVNVKIEDDEAASIILEMEDTSDEKLSDEIILDDMSEHISAEVPITIQLESTPQDLENIMSTHSEASIEHKGSSSHVDCPSSVTVTKKRHSCSVCEKSFLRPSNLVKHLKTHSGVKPFYCNKCQKSFPRLSYLVNHLKVHLTERDSSMCEKTFPTESHLSVYMAKHSGGKPFKCHKCYKSFAREGNLKTHKLTHIKKKHFACSFCESRFSLKGDLKRHLHCHTGEKPFSCSICQKSFRRKYHLDRHMNAH